MNPLTREELIELGMAFEPGPLIQWAERQLAAARRYEENFHSRGMDASRFLATEDLIKKVRVGWTESGFADTLSPEFSAEGRRVRAEAAEFRKEAGLIAKVAFGSEPDMLSKFRPGVPMGQLFARLADDLRSLVGLLLEHESRVAALGATPEFIGRGERLVADLERVRETQRSTSGALPPTVAQRYHDTGLLYDLIRTVVRIGRLEFMNDDRAGAAFTFRGSSLARRGLEKDRSRGHRIADR